MKQTILVTGGTGFIGSHTTVELQQAGYEVVIIDNLSNSNANVIDGIEKITGIRVKVKYSSEDVMQRETALSDLASKIKYEIEEK